MAHRLARDHFAHRLRSIRTDQRLTQEYLAERIGKTTEHISFLERGERSPSFEVLVDLAQALGVSPASLVDVDLGMPVDVTTMLTAGDVSPDLVVPVADAVGTMTERQSDLARLQSAFAGIRDMQRLATEYGINDILQDNGGKVLQVLILLGLKISPGREGNDAIDAEGNEYELKTLNRALRSTAGVTTHHHLNCDIIAKYRLVRAWYIAMYEGIELIEIYRVVPSILEPLFQKWEMIIDERGPMNNPKIPLRYVQQGERVYPASQASAQHTVPPRAGD